MAIVYNLCESSGDAMIFVLGGELNSLALQIIFSIIYHIIGSNKTFTFY